MVLGFGLGGIYGRINCSGTMNRDKKTIHKMLVNEQEFPATSSELQAILQRIVDDVVANLGCVGALVAPLEMGNALPIRAYSVNMSANLQKRLEERVGLSFLSPEAVAYLDDRKFKDNLSVQAVKARDILVSNKLYDLFRPVMNRHFSNLIQRATGIKQVVAVPFRIGDEVVGNLFATSSQEFSEREIDFLTAFGNQAAIAIQTQRYLTEMQALERVILSLQANITDETQVLQIIVDTVVQKLGYIAAMVATLEADKSLPVRTYAVGFDSATLKHLENTAGIGLASSKAVAYLDDERYKDNLSVRAIKGADGRPENCIVSDRLYDLFRPVVNKPLSNLVQKLTGIKQVMVMPFFINNEAMGNLFVASRKSQFSEREQEILATFSQQAAVGVRNARLYHVAEERRQIAQMFGKMAFSAAANIHALRNHVGATRTFLQLLELGDRLMEDQREKLLESGSDALTHLNEAVEILDNLHEPWRQSLDVPTDVNACLHLAVRKVFPGTIFDMTQDYVTTGEGVVIHKSLSEKLPMIKTSPDMLTEAFRVVAKNAVEAIKRRKSGRNLWVESRFQPGSVIAVVIRDDGIGVRSKNLSRIFEMGWSTKKGEGMGFGLYWARDYLEGLGGSITVASERKKGTTFTISLPATVE
jgi:signal transduction histidine kinase